MNISLRKFQVQFVVHFQKTAFKKFRVHFVFFPKKISSRKFQVQFVLHSQKNSLQEIPSSICVFFHIKLVQKNS